MSTSRRKFLAQAAVATALAGRTSTLTAWDNSKTSHPPNVVFIITDNQGAWTLGCNGNPDIRTPNIDRLAADGVRFSRALSSSPVCSPSRASYLTGLIPSQHGILDWFENSAVLGPHAYDAVAEFQTLPHILRNAGYTCGMFGKWHLGNSLRPVQGFTSWAALPGGATTTFYDADVAEDGKIRKQPGYLTDFWTKCGVEFIETNKDRPFFLYLAYNGPWGCGAPMTRRARNRHADQYDSADLLSFPRDSMHPWQHDNKGFHNTPTAMRRLASECSGIDDGVGEIMATLQQLGLEENTLIIYTADHGYMGGHNGIWGMSDHTRPFGAHEMMMQVPLIFRHPGKIPAGVTNDIIVSNYDFLPTMLHHLSLEQHIPTSHPSPGRDYSAFLRGSHIPWENFHYCEMELTRTIRDERWKYVGRHPDGPNELYDLSIDPHERVNLFGQRRLTSIQQKMANRLDAFYNRYADPRYDVWRGGAPKFGTWSAPNQNLTDGESAPADFPS